MKKKKALPSKDSVYSALQVEAVFNAITNNPAYFERKVRRWFSKTYNTPLYDTFNIPWVDILIHYYESALENRTFNEIFDIAVDNYLPEFVDRREEEDRAFAQSLVEEQRRTVEKQKQRKAAQSTNKKNAPQKGAEAPQKGEEIMNLTFDDEGNPDED